MHEYSGAMAHEHVLGNEPEMERMRIRGRNVADSLAAETEEDRVRWRGEEEGVCPVCHCDMLTVSKDRRSIECPVCGMYGSLTIEDGEIKAHFSEEEKLRQDCAGTGSWSTRRRSRRRRRCRDRFRICQSAKSPISAMRRNRFLRDGAGVIFEPRKCDSL